MRDAFTNRLCMCDPTLLNLSTAPKKAVWFGLPPLVFTPKVAAAGASVTELRAFCLQQGTVITGAAVDREREGREAIAVAHPLARALVTWFRDQGDETNAAKVDLPESGWRRLRDQLMVVRCLPRLTLGVRECGQPVGWRRKIWKIAAQPCPRAGGPPALRR